MIIRWNQDPKCKSQFPVPLHKIYRTLKDLKNKKYGKSPTNCDEIKAAFENPAIMNDLGTSLHRERGNLYNYTHEENDFSYTIFSSPKSIQLITDNLDESERFYLIDGTFKITPMCNVFQQVLIIHAQFGIKVRIQLFENQLIARFFST